MDSASGSPERNSPRSPTSGSAPGGARGPRRQDPEYGWGFCGLVLCFACGGPPGLAVAAVALHRSRRRGYTNAAAAAGVVIGAVLSIALAVLVLLAVLHAP